jgi:hypothetical protein
MEARDVDAHELRVCLAAATRLVSAIAHAVRCCAADECESESDEDEGASRMYT